MNINLKGWGCSLF